ncbi:D-hexose-6-phosphate mutarotase [Pokkaliibacter sp. CJK22405]|uniref:D-hexose-6-phosphate mutarotase n=1 Tax=Pokkaliibacter sp. CJK22405 TaxID=3384615 RepID=UPI003984B91C
MSYPQWLKVEPWGEHEVLVVSAPHAELKISLYGAHVLSYTPQGKSELLWLSSSAIFKKGKAIRGGIPLCWPGFAEGAEPFHGTARISEWQLDSYSLNDQLATLSFSPKVQTNLEATLTLEISEQLIMTLSTLNRSKESFRLTQAFHSYFAVSDYRQVAIDGLQGAVFEEKLEQGARYQQMGVLKPCRALDRIYGSAGEVSFTDSVTGRQVSIVKTGSKSTVVWQPGEAAAGMADVSQDTAEQFICIEVANTHLDPVMLKTGESSQMYMKISCL